MRALVQLLARVSLDEPGRQKLLDLDDAFDDTAPEAYQAARLTLAPAAANIAVPFGGVNISTTTVIMARGDITVKLNGSGNTAVDVITTPAALAGEAISDWQKYDKPGFVLWRGHITSLHLGNPGTAPVDVDVFLIGEAP